MTKKDSAPPPPGVVAIFTDEKGNVIAQASCFNASRMGGHTLAEAQRARARERLNGEVIRAYASPQLARAITNWGASEILRTLIHMHDCHVTYVEVGHEGSRS